MTFSRLNAWGAAALHQLRPGCLVAAALYMATARELIDSHRSIPGPGLA